MTKTRRLVLSLLAMLAILFTPHFKELGYTGKFFASASTQAQKLPPELLKLLNPDPVVPKVAERPKLEKGERFVPVLHLIGQIDEDLSDKLIKDIADANTLKADFIVMEIDSPGGSVDAGEKLARAIEDSQIPIHCFVTGISASMAFYALQSCATKSMADTSRLLMHQAFLGGLNSNGNAVKQQDLENIYNLLRVMNESMLVHYAKHMKLSKDKIAAKIAAGRDWWMESQEAIKVGAVERTDASLKSIVKSYHDLGHAPRLGAAVPQKHKNKQKKAEINYCQ